MYSYVKGLSLMFDKQYLYYVCVDDPAGLEPSDAVGEAGDSTHDKGIVLTHQNPLKFRSEKPHSLTCNRTTATDLRNNY